MDAIESVLDFFKRRPFTATLLGLTTVLVGEAIVAVGVIATPALGLAAIPFLVLGGVLVGGGLVVMAYGAFYLERSVRTGFNMRFRVSTTAGPTLGPYALPPIPDAATPADVEGLSLPLTVPPGVCVYFVFSPGIADEYRILPPSGLDDIQVVAQGGAYTVEVAKKYRGPYYSATTGPDDSSAGTGNSNWDVPLSGSPWPWVRICAIGPTVLLDVSDLDH